MDNRMTSVMALAAGIAVGINWPKIKKYTTPHIKKAGKITYGCYSTTAGYLSKKTKDFKKMVIKPKKKNETVKKVAARKKRGRRRAAVAQA